MLIPKPQGLLLQWKICFFSLKCAYTLSGEISSGPEESALLTKTKATFTELF